MSLLCLQARLRELQAAGLKCSTLSAARSATLALSLFLACWPAESFAQAQTQPIPQAVTAPEPKYIAVHESADGSTLSLQVSSRRFKPASDQGPIIQLVGVVHIGDLAYYQQLQTHLKDFDLVLFEGVKPGAAAVAIDNADDAAKVKLTKSRQRLLAIMIERYRKQNGAYPESLEGLAGKLPGSQARVVTGAMLDAWGKPFEYTQDAGGNAGPDGLPAKAAPSFDLVSQGNGTPQTLVKFSQQPPLTKSERASGSGQGIQTKLAEALGLSFQLSVMDYNHASWRNSDMTIDEVQAKMAESGASADALFKMLDGSSLSGRIAGFILGIVKANPQLALMTKVMMIETLANADELMEAQTRTTDGGMSAFMKVIVHDRNEAVFADLEKVLADEPHMKSVAIFYGAGHLQDMEQRLLTKFGYTFESQTWFDAISVDTKDEPATAAQVKSYRKMMRQMIEQGRGKPEPAAP